MVYNLQLYKSLYWINKMEKMVENITKASLNDCDKENLKDFLFVDSND